MRQKCVKIASKMRQKCAETPLGENTFWAIPIFLGNVLFVRESPCPSSLCFFFEFLVFSLRGFPSSL